MNKLDKKDLRILSILDMDGRIPIPQLAKKVGVSRQVAEYRINKLVSEGVITKIGAVYDQKVCGQNIYRVLFQLYNIEENEIYEFIEYLKKNYKIMWLARLGGGWDLVINFLEKDIYEFDKLFMKITDDYNKIIQNYIILTYVNITDTARGYLTDYKQSKVFFHEMSNNTIKLDQRDKKIIELLGDNARISNIEIGQKVGLTGNAVKYRINQFGESKFLLGFRTSINSTKLGYQNFLVFLIIRNLKTSDEKTFFSYIKMHKNVTYIVKHIGEFRMGLEIETKSVEELERIIRELRTKFSDIINDVKIFPVLEEFVINYVP